jgi:hypothetical protein
MFPEISQKKTRRILTWSHVLAIPTLITSLFLVLEHQLGWIALLSTTISVFFSSLMHISESKHGIDPGPYWKHWSNTYLWCDRLAAYWIGLFTLWMWIARTHRPLSPLMLALIGIPCMIMGEHKRGITLLEYVYFHLLWHLCAFTAITLVFEGAIVYNGACSTIFTPWECTGSTYTFWPV